jgi:CheY-like chemotaxis protein
MTHLNQPLLVVEDSNDDFKMLQRLMRRLSVQNPIYRCTNGDAALEFLDRTVEQTVDHPRPSVILLDLNLPGVDGRAVLEEVKQNQCFKEIPIVIFTTSSNPQDIQFCYEKGANGYLIKPMDAVELQKTVQAFVGFWLEANTLPQPS